MFKELKFVQGAVAKKDFIPAMTHFEIKNGRVTAFNGTIALSSPIACNLDCKPKAGPMVQAIARCEDTIQLSMTPAGRLSVRSGKFKAFIECTEDDSPHAEPSGDEVAFDGAMLLRAFQELQPFVGNDASRPFTNGILVKGQSAYATNNVCLAQFFLGFTLPSVVNLPRSAVAEILRINLAPVRMLVENNSVTFEYEDGRWLRTQLFSTEWPDVDSILNRDHGATPLNEELFKALEAVKPFCDKNGRVILEGCTVRTHDSLEEGSSYSLHDEINWPLSSYRIEMLSLLEGVQFFDAQSFPAPGLFFKGDRMRGAIIGLRL